MSSTPIGDPRPAGEEGPAGDQRKAGEEGVAGDPRPAGEEKLKASAKKKAAKSTGDGDD
jgi:hypothetical protein